MRTRSLPAQPYRAYTNLLWREVRRRYLEGEHAPALCAEFGLSVGTLYSKAAKEGWRKKDAPTPPPPPSAGEAADQAIWAAQMASARGDFTEAEKQSQIAERFSRIAQRGGLDLTRIEREPGEPCPLCGQTPRDLSDDGTAFRLDLEERINRVRLEERRGRDELKQTNRPEWDRQYALARMDAMTAVYETWEGDARAFRHAPQADAEAAP